MKAIKNFLLGVIILFTTISFYPATAQTISKHVIFDHDGGVDDLLSLLLLTQMENVELEGVVVTPADCFLEDATISSLKLLKMTGLTNVSVAKSQARAVNPFPTEWRAQPMVLNAFPDMLTIQGNNQQLSTLPAYEFIASKLRSANEQLTFLITGPCSNLAKTLGTYPELKSKVGEVIWMGGAVDVPGNVRTHKHNGTAEWNAYWDPQAAAELFKMGLDIKLIALDVTNSVPVSMNFLRQLAAQKQFPLSNLASQFWATTINTIPSYEYTYFMWDVLSTTYLGIPQTFTSERAELAVRTELPAEGQTIRAAGNENWVHIVKTVDREAFYGYVLGLLRR
ncbi:MAG: nucleoside hydrolase [Cytophagales bacterium]|nr:nucleoside hydrolase [Cytophagales bacterium]